MAWGGVDGVEVPLLPGRIALPVEGRVALLLLGVDGVDGRVAGVVVGRAAGVAVGRVLLEGAEGVDGRATGVAEGLAAGVAAGRVVDAGRDELPPMVRLWVAVERDAVPLALSRASTDWVAISMHPASIRAKGRTIVRISVSFKNGLITSFIY